MYMRMQPDIRIFPNAVYTARLFRCYSCIWKTKIGKYIIVFNAELIKPSLPWQDQLRFCGKLPTYPSPKPHFALSEQVVLMLCQGRGSWSEKKKKIDFLSVYPWGYSLPIGWGSPSLNMVSMLPLLAQCCRCDPQIGYRYSIR